MGVIHTDRLRPGQLLAEDVQDINGRLLLTKGKEIQSKHIRIFKIWGISEVKIVDDSQSNAEMRAEEHTQNIEQVEDAVKTVFRHTDLEHPAIREIFNLAVTYRSTQNVVETGGDIDLKECAISEENREKDFINKLSQKKIILPEIPSIVFELNEVIANPVSSVEQIAQVVNKSPSLTALLLKIVNSSFYGFPSKIIGISHAVTLIGTREISGLALGISILSIFKKIPKEIIDMYSFLKHSLACGILSRILAANINFPQTEQLFVSGLLHDLGRLIFYIHFPEESRNVLSRSKNRCNLLYEEETDYLGCNHAQIGKQLLKQWKLPLILENNVLYHHSPSEAQQLIPAALVHLSDIIVNALGIGSSGEQFVPPIDNKAWEELEIAPSCFETVIGQAIHQFYGLETVLQA